MADGKILNSGLQYVPQIAVQYIYLDFDGELTSYNGEILSLENVEVQNSSLTEERIQNILAELNARYADQNIVFVTHRPTVAGYSTIFIGKTAAFDRYGSFAGLAETIDENNLNKTDNAFVMLDSTATDPEIIATIAHETDHLLGTLNHGGEGLQAYAYRYDVSSGITSSGITLNDDSMYVYSGGTATATTVNWRGYLYVSSGGTATSTTVNSNGLMLVSSGGTATATTVNSSGDLYVYDGGTATSTTVNGGGRLSVSSGGIVNNATIAGGSMSVFSGGLASNINGTFYAEAGATVNGILYNSPFVVSKIFDSGFAYFTGMYTILNNAYLHTQVLSGASVCMCDAIGFNPVYFENTIVYSGGIMEVVDNVYLTLGVAGYSAGEARGIL